MIDCLTVFSKIFRYGSGYFLRCLLSSLILTACKNNLGLCLRRIAKTNIYPLRELNTPWSLLPFNRSLCQFTKYRSFKFNSANTYAIFIDWVTNYHLDSMQPKRLYHMRIRYIRLIPLSLGLVAALSVYYSLLVSCIPRL